MCQIMEDLRAESEARGRLSNAIDTAKNLLQMNVGTHEEIARATRLPIEKVRELAGLIAAQA